jgi:tetratricopeptide (TPR) repeat protein
MEAMKPSCLWRAILVLFLVLAGGPFAKAQGQKDEGTPQQRAEALHAQGMKYYDLAQFDRAIEAFKAAYDLSPAPALLFNIAQAYRKLGPGSCSQAIYFYRAFLRLDPNAKNRPAAEARISELETCAQDEERIQKDSLRQDAEREKPDRVKPPGASLPGDRDEPRAERARWPAVAFLGAGVALVATGVVLDLSARSDFDQLQRSCMTTPCASANWESPQVHERVGIALSITGAAALVAGTVWWLYTRDKPSPTRAFHADGGMVGLFRF